MEIQRNKVNSSVEKEIITGIIVNNEFCGKVLKIARAEYFKSDFTKIIFQWCKEYYDQYEQTPFKDIQSIYEDQKTSLKPAEAEIIGTFLNQLSKDYENQAPFNYDSLYGRTKNYFKDRALELHTEKVDHLRKKGRLEEAEELIKNFNNSEFIDDDEDQLMSVEDFMKIEIPERRTFLDPFVQENQIILCTGARGVGKTWFGMAIADAISKGEGFGPWPSASAATVTFLDGEMSQVDIKNRLKFLSVDNPDKTRPLFIRNIAHEIEKNPREKFSLLDPRFRDKLRSQLLKTNSKVLIVDNLASLTGGIDENAKKDYDPINQFFISLRSQGITTIIIHHLGKSGEQRGTSAREDNVDTSIVLKLPEGYQAKDKAKFIVHFTKNRCAVSDWELLQDYLLQLTDSDNVAQWEYVPIEKSTKDFIIAMYLEGFKQDAIASEVGKSQSYVSRVIKNARTEGNIKLQ